jgi:NDP-sugar pyrophosphorylase family protein
MAQQRLTLTTPEDLRQINLVYLRQLNPYTPQIASPLPETTTCLPPVLIEAQVQIGAGCVIGPQVYLESGACVPAGLRLQRAVGLRGGFLLTEPTGDPMNESLPGRVDSLPNLD